MHCYVFPWFIFHGYSFKLRSEGGLNFLHILGTLSFDAIPSCAPHVWGIYVAGPFDEWVNMGSIRGMQIPRFLGEQVNSG